MAGERAVIGRLSTLRIVGPPLIVVAFMGLLLWMAFVRGYYRPHREGLQFGVGYFLPILIPCAVILAGWRHQLRQLLFRGGAGIWIADGRLHFMDGALRVEDIEALVVRYDRSTKGTPSALVFELKDGRRRRVSTWPFRTLVTEMTTKLEAHGIAMRSVRRQAADEPGGPR